MLRPIHAAHVKRAGLVREKAVNGGCVRMPGMRVVLFGNGPVALDVLRFLQAEGEEVVGLVLHEEEQRRLGDELIAVSGLPAERVFSASDLRQPSTVEALASLSADIGFSALFAAILKPAVLEIFGRGVVNVHPGYLPYNRGRNAQIWGIVEKTPVGATLHFMDEGVDTGPIIERLEVAIAPTDTGESVRLKLEQACVEVTRSGWASVRAGVTPEPQDLDEGTFHLVRDVEGIREIDLDAQVRAGDLIDLLRALTSPPQANGAFFETPGGRVRIRVELEPEE
jgi:methionyl-tRNA formyltransferase